MKVKKVRINFKRNKKSSNATGNADEAKGEWINPRLPKTKYGSNTFALGGFRPYLSGRGGISINFKSSASLGSSNTSLKNSKASSNDQEPPYDAPVLINASASPLNKGVELKEGGASLEITNDEPDVEGIIVFDIVLVMSLDGNEDKVVVALVILGDLGVEEEDEYFFEHSFQSFNTINMLLNSMEVKNVEHSKSDKQEKIHGGG